ncbi:MAG: MazG family protein, partial [Alphaproteobacteria bacterium]
MTTTPIERLIDVMARLRDPERGCPWDIEQNFETIAPYTIEEAYEVADAIGSGDKAVLLGELGDLLFQVVFYAQMSREEGGFDFDAIAEAVAGKMIRRHPHVFGDQEVKDADAQTRAWEAHKATERSDTGAPTATVLRAR